MTTEKIKVTQSDIDNAITSIPTEANPLSIAMLEASGSFHVVNLKASTMVNTEAGGFYKLSPDAKAFIERWDRGEKVEPCELEIEHVATNFYAYINGQKLEELT